MKVAGDGTSLTHHCFEQGHADWGDHQTDQQALHRERGPNRGSGGRGGGRGGGGSGEQRGMELEDEGGLTRQPG